MTSNRYQDDISLSTFVSDYADIENLLVCNLDVTWCMGGDLKHNYIIRKTSSESRCFNIYGNEFSQANSQITVFARVLLYMEKMKGDPSLPVNCDQSLFDSFYPLIKNTRLLALLGVPMSNGSWCKSVGAQLYKLDARDAALFDDFTRHACMYLLNFREQYKSDKADVSGSNQGNSSQITTSRNMPGANKLVALNPSDRTSLYKSSSDINSLPVFMPSTAVIPGHNETLNDFENDDYSFIVNSLISFRTNCQSFWSDLSFVNISTDNQPSLDSGVLNLRPFDETFYCRLIKEYQRYSISELSGKQASRVDKYKKAGGFLGGIVALFTSNPFAPLAGSSLGSMVAPRDKKIAEYMPDPELMFLSDEHSYMAMTHANASAHKLRRLIFHIVSAQDGQRYLRVLPAAISADGIIPLQAMKCLGNYFLRPVRAGIETYQDNYNANQIHKLYYHSLRGSGTQHKTDLKLSINDPDLGQYDEVVYRFESSSPKNPSYYYFDYETEPSHIF